MRSLRSFLRPGIIAAVALAPHAANANPLFPGAVQSHLGLSYTPPCTICHTGVVGSQGTATKPFALAMKMEGGLSGLDPSTVGPALDTLQAMGTDSDCNNIPDIQQLKDGRDPNAPGDYIDNSGRTAPADPGCSNSSSVMPAFGCGAQLAPPSTPSDAAPLLAALATALGVALTRLRPRRRR